MTRCCTFSGGLILPSESGRGENEYLLRLSIEKDDNRVFGEGGASQTSRKYNQIGPVKPNVH